MEVLDNIIMNGQDINGVDQVEGYLRTSGTSKITVSTTPPSNPVAGDLWLDIS